MTGAVLLAALLGGWLWGASGRSELVRALRTAELTRDVVEARASLLEARVSIGDADFDRVTQRLQQARGFLWRARAGLSGSGAIDADKRLELDSLFAGIDETQRLVGAAASQARDRRHLQRTLRPGSQTPAIAIPGSTRPAAASLDSTEPSREP